MLLAQFVLILIGASRMNSECFDVPENRISRNGLALFHEDCGEGAGGCRAKIELEGVGVIGDLSQRVMTVDRAVYTDILHFCARVLAVTPALCVGRL
jgi:hypothetical protein